MTEKQARALYRILKGAETFDYSRGAGTYEIKEYKVEETEYFLSVVLEVGMIGDEGTMAQVFCRDRVHLFVGKRGGITYPVTNKRGQWVQRQLSKTTLYGAMYDQKYGG